MNSILSVKGLSMAFGAHQVLHKLDLELEPDRVHVLLGANGVGKSTLLRCLLGLVQLEPGVVRFLGEDIGKATPALRAQMGYVPDEPDVYGWMTAPELFIFLSRQYGQWSSKKEQELSERLRVPQGTAIASMSRGEAAKTMLVAALAAKPRLLLLDEPFARLDPPTREQVLGVLLGEAPIEGGTVLLATHDLEVAARAADRVLLLHAGRIEKQVDVEELQPEEDGGSRLTAHLRDLYPSETAESIA